VQAPAKKRMIIRKALSTRCSALVKDTAKRSDLFVSEQRIFKTTTVLKGRVTILQRTRMAMHFDNQSCVGMSLRIIAVTGRCWQ